MTPNGINANNQKITGLAKGTDPTDAVNFSQLQDAIGGTAKASTVKAKNSNITVEEGTNAAGGKEFTIGLGDKITLGTANPVSVDGTAGTVTGLTNTAWDVDNPQAVTGRAATEDQLKSVNTQVNTNKDKIAKIRLILQKINKILLKIRKILRLIEMLFLPSIRLLLKVLILMEIAAL